MKCLVSPTMRFNTRQTLSTYIGAFYPGLSHPNLVYRIAAKDHQLFEEISNIKYRGQNQKKILKRELERRNRK